jgi:sugar lactone lactonase YvrE
LIRRILIAAAGLCALGAAARTPACGPPLLSMRVPAGPYVPGSRIRPRGSNATARAASGAASLAGDGTFLTSDVRAREHAYLIAGDTNAIAVSRITIVPAPASRAPLLAVAAYDDGIVLHDPRTFARIATLATGGAPADVAFEPSGAIASADTDGDSLTIATRSPWTVNAIANVPVGDEVVTDPGGAGTFVSDRSVDGAGALTRVSPDGSVTRIVTGDTAEGLAIDDARGLIYVANVNDGTVLAVNMRSMRAVRRIRAVPRVFGIVLSHDGRTLYAVANQSATSPFHTPGYVAAINVASGRTIARSRPLSFPLDAALDATSGRLFVTDEGSNLVYVLNSGTLRDARAPLATCRTPWKPYVDFATQRLFVPCARSNEIDVFDTSTYRRVRGAPFATGGYPLAVSVWRPGSRVER